MYSTLRPSETSRVETLDCAPTLTLIGNANDVILGVPGVGFDGPDGMTEPPFEFEPDGLE